jgi:hypothetical protein
LNNNATAQQSCRETEKPIRRDTNDKQGDATCAITETTIKMKVSLSKSWDIGSTRWRRLVFMMPMILGAPQGAAHQWEGASVS